MPDASGHHHSAARLQSRGTAARPVAVLHAQLTGEHEEDLAACRMHFPNVRMQVVAVGDLKDPEQVSFGETRELSLEITLEDRRMTAWTDVDGGPGERKGFDGESGFHA